MISIITSTLGAYQRSARDAFLMVCKNWLILPSSILLFISFLIAASIFSPLGFVGSFIVGLIQIALLSLYYSWIRASVRKEKLSWRDLYEFDPTLFWNFLGVAFVLSIGDLLFRESFQKSAELSWIPAIFGLAVFVILNAIPEVTYELEQDVFPGVQSAFNFIKEHWIEWFIPMVLVLIPALSIGSIYALQILANSSGKVLLPIYVVIQSISGALPSLSYGGLLIAILVGTWFMVFRGFLFKELSSGNRRARDFHYRSR